MAPPARRNAAAGSGTLPAMLARALGLTLVLFAACGGGHPDRSTVPAAPAPVAGAPAPATPAPAEAAPALTCEDACTEIGSCYEEVNGGEYTEGGQCVSSCDDKSEAERAAYFACLRAAADCTGTLAC